MKNSVSMNIVFLLTTSFAQLSAEPTYDVLQYYRLLPEAITGTKYKIQRAGDDFVYENMHGRLETIVLDFSNGYMLVDDHGTGGGTVEHELAVFKADSGKHYIAFNRRTFDGLRMKSRLRIFTYDGSTFHECTERVLPTIELGHFLKVSLNTKDLETVKEEWLLSIYFELPHYGTTINARLDSNVLRNYDHMGSRSRPDSFYQGLIDQLRRDTIHLVWNGSAPRFTFHTP